MLDRFFGPLVLLAAVLVPAAAFGQAEWSAADAVDASLRHAEMSGVREARVAGAHAALEGAVAYETPTLNLAYQRDRSAAGDSAEFSATVEQSIDWVRWREELEATLPYREEALDAELRSWELDVTNRVLQAFYDARYYEERVAILRSWVDTLEASAEGVRARVEQGDAARLHVLQVEQAIALAEGRTAAAERALAAAWSELVRWTGWTEEARLRGPLVPAALPGTDEEYDPVVARLVALEQAAAREVQAWRHPGLRDWSVGLGYRHVSVDGTSGHGAMVTVSAPLAVWNTFRPQRERLEAEQSALAAEAEVRRALHSREIASAQLRLVTAVSALESAPPPQSDDVASVAEVAFRAGEVALADLLNVLETATELRLARLDLQRDVRVASLSYQHSLGLGVQP